jgi:hypothetical protein
MSAAMKKARLPETIRCPKKHLLTSGRLAGRVKATGGLNVSAKRFHGRGTDIFFGA